MIQPTRTANSSVSVDGFFAAQFAKSPEGGEWLIFVAGVLEHALGRRTDKEDVTVADLLLLRSHADGAAPRRAEKDARASDGLEGGLGALADQIRLDDTELLDRGVIQDRAGARAVGGTVQGHVRVVSRRHLLR